MGSKGAPESAGASQHPVTIVENPPAETVQPGAYERQEAGRQGGEEMKGEGTPRLEDANPCGPRAGNWRNNCKTLGGPALQKRNVASAGEKSPSLSFQPARPCATAFPRGVRIATTRRCGSHELGDARRRASSLGRVSGSCRRAAPKHGRLASADRGLDARACDVRRRGRGRPRTPRRLDSWPARSRGRCRARAALAPLSRHAVDGLRCRECRDV
jgi:hypothetical protein